MSRGAQSFVCLPNRAREHRQAPGPRYACVGEVPAVPWPQFYLGGEACEANGQDGPVRKEACWEPLKTPGARIPGLLLAPRSRRACLWQNSDCSSNWHGLFGTVKALLIIQKRSSRWEYIGAIVEAISGALETAPRSHGATRTSCSAVVFGALRLRDDATETAVGPPNTFRAPASPRTSRSPPAKAARTRRRFSRVLHKKQQNNKTP